MSYLYYNEKIIIFVCFFIFVCLLLFFLWLCYLWDLNPSYLQYLEFYVNIFGNLIYSEINETEIVFSPFVVGLSVWIGSVREV